MRRLLLSVIRKVLPRTVRRHRILGGPVSGRFIYASWYNYPTAILGRAEPELGAWADQNLAEGETWLDIGAHYGYTALMLRERVGGMAGFSPSRRVSPRPDTWLKQPARMASPISPPCPWRWAMFLISLLSGAKRIFAA